LQSKTRVRWAAPPLSPILHEMLPKFYQDWIYGWAPMRFLSDGIRDLFYISGDVWNSNMSIMACFGAGGVILAFLSLVKKTRQKKANEASE